MRDLFRQFAFAAVLLTIAVVAHAAPPSLPDTSVFPNSLGVNIHFTDPKPGELEQIYAAGFRWVRMDFGWGGIEREKGQYDFSAYDHLLSALDRYHIKAYFILDYSNRNYDNDQSPSSDEGRAAFARWAAASVHHFKGHGILWEMYNEPNITFWRPKPNADDYAKLALAVGKAIREAEPAEIFIGPATSTIDLPFLETCFKAGCLEYWSAVSVHPYRQKDPETVADEYRKLRMLIAQYAKKDRKIPIISGEWGYSSVWKDFDEDRQAKYLPREILTNIANDVPLSIWYDWHEDGKDPKEGEHHFGIVRPDEVNKDGNLYEPKKAYLAAKYLSKFLDGARFNKQLFTGDRNILHDGENDHVLLFEDKTGQPIFVCWTTIAAHDIQLPIRSGASVNRPAGMSPDLPPSTDRTQFKIDDSPAYVTPKGEEPLLQLGLTWTRAPLDITAAGPLVANVETTVRNPLKYPVHISDETNFALIQALDQGASSKIAGRGWIGRSASNAAAETVLGTRDLGWLIQHTGLISTNPLRAIFFPPDGDSQSVMVENPTADAFKAIASIMLPKSRIDIPVEFKTGENSKLIPFVLPKGLSGSPLTGLWLVTSPGNLVLYGLHDAQYAALPASPATWNLTSDGDPRVKSELGFSSQNPTDGPVAPNRESLKINYYFDNGWKFIRVAPGPRADAKIEGEPTALGLWIHGDGQGNLARMRFTDSTGQTFQPDGGRITWTGWRYVEFPFTDHDLAHWGGANDGVVHFPVHIDTLFLLDSHDRQATDGEIYLSTPTVIYAK